MAVYNNLSCETYIAGEDLSAAQYKFVRINAGTDSTVVLSGAGERADGVLINDPTSGKAATVARDGDPMVYAGGTIADGAEIAVDANGDAVAAASTDVIVGYAREAAVDGQLFQITFSRAEAVKA